MARDANGLSAIAGTALQITPASLAIAQSAMTNKPGLGARLSSPADGRLVVVAGDGDPSNCDRGVTASTRTRSRDDGRRLTIVAVDDAVRGRLAAIPGDWLLRGCKDPADNCLGDLAAGTYPSQFVTPRLEHDASWMPDYGAVTLHRAGWLGERRDWPEYLSLVPSADYAGFGPTGGPDGTFHEIVVRANPAMSDQAADCTGTALTTDRALRPGVHRCRSAASRGSPPPSTAITVGRHQGQYVDVKVAPDWTGICPDIEDGTHGGRPS